MDVLGWFAKRSRSQSCTRLSPRATLTTSFVLSNVVHKHLVVGYLPVFFSFGYMLKIKSAAFKLSGYM